MYRLLRLKPTRYLLLYFGLIVFSFFLFAQWAKVVPKSLIDLGFIFVIFTFAIGYLFWIYLLLYGFKYLDNKNGYENDFKKTQLQIVALLLTLCIHIFLVFKFPPQKENAGLSIIAIIATTSTLIYLYLKIVGILTKKFRFYDKKTAPKLWDYSVTIFSLGFFPFGILMMHSHLRLILKEQE